MTSGHFMMDKSRIRVRITNEKDEAAWNDYVSCDSEAGPYHLFGWKNAVEKAYGHKGYYLLAEDVGSGKCLGVLPLVYFKIPFTKGSLVSLPYCDYAGPLGPRFVKEILTVQCKVLAKELGVSKVELRRPVDEVISDAESGWTQEIISNKVRVVLPLPPVSDDLWQSMKSKLRSQVRRPEKEGLTFRLGGIEMLDEFYHVFAENMRDLGSPVHSRKWFDALLASSPDSARIGTVYLPSGEPCASGIIMTVGGKACIPWASSRRASNKYSPTMMLYWRFLAWAADNGFQEFDFGRSTPGGGTYKFKMQWGGQPKSLYWQIYRCAEHFSRSGNEAAKNTSACRRLVENIWKRLPLCLANPIGSAVRGYISL